jgi:TetR/AcrR family transcriptional regulator, regulator of cefoperazone and chloramphenicol sensitivity
MMDFATVLSVPAREQPLFKSRDRILQIATELFADRGFDAVTVRDLAQRANVNIAAVNYHFRSKDDLYKAVIDQAFARWAREVVIVETASSSETPESVIRAIVESLLDPVLLRPKRPDHIRLLGWELLRTTSLASDSDVAPTFLPLVQTVAAALRRSALRSAPIDELDAALLAHGIIGQCLLVGSAMQATPDQDSQPSRSATLIDQMVAIALGGLSAIAGRKLPGPQQ